MDQRGRPIRLAVALLLALQWAAAFAHCVAGLQANPWLIEICSSDGPRSIDIGADGQPGQPGQPGTQDHCPLCPAVAMVAQQQASSPALPVRYFQSAPVLAEGLSVGAARAPPQQPRAPPLA